MELLRTLLFVPGNRSRMIDKVRDLHPDALIFDLEDSVPPAEKATARSTVREALDGDFAAPRLFVRVNSAATALLGDDLDAVVSPRLYSIVLPKVESPEQVADVHRMLEQRERAAGVAAGRTRILPIVESVRGILNLDRIAGCSARLVGLCFGAEDFTVDLGVERTSEGIEVQFPRSQVPLYARLADIVAVDTPFVDVNDDQGLARDTRLARQLGYRGKLLIHPRQIDVVNRVFAPSEQEIEHAMRVVAVYEEAEARGEASVALDGKMVDVPIVERARSLLKLAAQLSSVE